MKRVLLWSLAIVGIGAVALVAAGSILYASARTSNVGELSFVNELQIPTLLEPREQAGRKVFDMRLQRGTTEFVPGKQAETWGANGSYLGPTLRASRGDEVELRVRNALGETTTIHWHGMHLPAAADGGPHQPIAPGTTWAPRWEIDQPAATLWYHPHPHGETADHVYRGQAGMFILDDRVADALPLPNDYGVDDIPSSSRTSGLATRAPSTSRRASSVRPGDSATRSSSTAPTTRTSRSGTRAFACGCLTPRTRASTTSALPAGGHSSWSEPTAAC